MDYNNRHDFHNTTNLTFWKQFVIIKCGCGCEIKLTIFFSSSSFSSISLNSKFKAVVTLLLIYSIYHNIKYKLLMWVKLFSKKEKQTNASQRLNKLKDPSLAKIEIEFIRKAIDTTRMVSLFDVCLSSWWAGSNTLLISERASHGYFFHLSRAISVCHCNGLVIFMPEYRKCPNRVDDERWTS